jgi:hypothetical protein
MSNPTGNTAVTSSISSCPEAQPNDGGLCIIGAGFGRTGTSSLREALNILGYGPCYHMREVVSDPKKLDTWDRIGLGGAVPNWDLVFRHYRSTMDHPAVAYWEELMQYYPNAKVILTTREEEKWWDSFHDTICPASWQWSLLLQLTLVSSMKFRRMCRNCIWNPLFGSVQGARDRNKAMAAFLRHNEHVQNTVPKERLLVFNVKEGWEPLCTFLECPIPNVPFPHVNDGAQFKNMVATSRRKAVGRLIGVVVVVVGYAFSRFSGKNDR